MTKPTDAQISAAKAIFDYFVRNSREMATWENARLFYIQAAKAALTAAIRALKDKSVSDAFGGPFPEEEP